MSNTKWLKLGAVLIGSTATVAVANPAATPGQVFSCSLGAKSILVTASGKSLVYQYGSVGAPEMTLVGDVNRGNVKYKLETFNHSAETELRFSNGAYSYVLFSHYSTPDYSGKGAVDRSGLAVFRGSQKLSDKTCRGGKGFSPSYNFDWIPVYTGDLLDID